MTRVVIICGTGGVGKTTTSAAAALGEALRGHRAVVLTIDPARRLADALGIDGLGNTPQPVTLDGLAVPAGGSMHALMLDRKATWDEVIRRYAPDKDTADNLLNNRYYRAVSTRLTGSHEYMAIEKLHQLMESGQWDVVVVDTPPSRHAIDFLRAPDRISRLLNQRVLGTLLDSTDSWLGIASRRIAGLIRRITGESVVDELGEFFQLFSGLSSGFLKRSDEVLRFLNSEKTTCFLVTSAQLAIADSSLDFLNELRARRIPLGGVLVNRILPRPAVSESADTLRFPACPEDISSADWDLQIDALRTMLTHRIRTADEHLATLDYYRNATQAPVWGIPTLNHNILTLEGLSDLAQSLPPLTLTDHTERR